VPDWTPELAPEPPKPGSGREGTALLEEVADERPADLVPEGRTDRPEVLVVTPEETVPRESFCPERRRLPESGLVAGLLPGLRGVDLPTDVELPRLLLELADDGLALRPVVDCGLDCRDDFADGRLWGVGVDLRVDGDFTDELDREDRTGVAAGRDLEEVRGELRAEDLLLLAFVLEDEEPFR